MQDVYFIFNNKKCTDMGVEISEFPALQHPERRVEVIEVDGMDVLILLGLLLLGLFH